MKKVAQKAIALVLGFSFSFVLVEIMARIVFSQVIVYDVEMSKYAVRLKTPSANANISHEHIPSSQSQLMGVEIEINSQGYRDSEVSVIKSSDIIRVMMLGDSITFGWGVEDQDTFSSLVERELTMYTSLEVEVINTGVGNYNTVQEVAAFEESGIQFDADFIVVNFFLNDAELVPTRSRTGAILENFESLVFLWSRIDGIMRSAGQRPDAIAYYNSLYSEDSRGWDESKDALRRLNQLIEEYDTQMMLVVIPDLHEHEGNYPFDNVHKSVMDFAASEEIAAVDLLTYIEDVVDLTTLWVSRDDAHPNALGHSLLAKGIVDGLITELGFPKGR